jgi:DUF971 family protein
MSHEGIRFVSAAEARAQALEEERSARVFSAEATEPAKVRVHKTEGTGMEITWRDGHHSAWSFKWLRDACPCATCHDEREKSGRQPGAPKPAPASLLPMYQAPPRPDIVTPVGRYAISFHWNDGHSSGIYSWEYLRRHCQCDEWQANSTAAL